MLAGLSPQGEILTAGRVDEVKRVAGFDLIWSAPKSVSLLFGLSDPATSAIVRGVHEDAVEQGIRPTCSAMLVGYARVLAERAAPRRKDSW